MIAKKHTLFIKLISASEIVYFAIFDTTIYMVSYVFVTYTRI